MCSYLFLNLELNFSWPSGTSKYVCHIEFEKPNYSDTKIWQQKTSLHSLDGLAYLLLEKKHDDGRQKSYFAEMILLHWNYQNLKW